MMKSVSCCCVRGSRLFSDLVTFCDGLLMWGQRVVIPEPLQVEVLHKLYGGHQGITRCRSRAKISVWWPGLTQQLRRFIQNCPQCARDYRPNKEPLITSTLPDYPWQQVVADLFQLKGANYLVIVDYFSRYPEVHKLTTTTSQSIINSLKTVFAHHGIPETLRELTMVLSLAHSSLQNSRRNNMILLILLVALTSLLVMDKQKGHCRQLNVF